MDNGMLIRILIIVLAVVTLVVIVQRYNKLQQYKESERFYDYSNGNGIRVIPADMSTSAPIKHPAPVPPSDDPLPSLPPDNVATPSRDQIANDQRAIAYFQKSQDDITKFYDEFAGPSFEDSDCAKKPSSCVSKNKLTADDLLPRDASNTKWAQINPVGAGTIKDQNFLQAGYHVGLNTSQGAKRNGNWQVRSEPPNSKAIVSPWLNSDYEPDLLRKPLEVGEA